MARHRDDTRWTALDRLGAALAAVAVRIRPSTAASPAGRRTSREPAGTT